MASTLSLHPGLAESSRLSWLTRPQSRATAMEFAILVSAGVTAALLTTFVNLHLRIPGHAILKVVFPTALGLAAVPRRGAGTVIGLSGMATAVCLRFAGAHAADLGLGALTSLAIIGPMLDWMMHRVKSSWGVYVSLAMGGLLTNATALLVRGGSKWFGFEPIGKRPILDWLSQAIVSYAVCGLVAGLVSALLLFYIRSRPERVTVPDSNEAAPAVEVA